MKQVIRKIMSSIMAIVVLLTTMSFTIDMHYCGKKLVNVSIIHKAKPCIMKVRGLDSCSNQILISKKPCCSNKQLIVKGQDNLKNTNNFFTFGQQIFITSLIYTYINFFEDGKQDKNIHISKQSPILVKDRYLHYETYLI